MNTQDYLKALKTLGLLPTSKATVEALGLSVRQLIRLAHGAPIPKTLALLIAALLKLHSIGTTLNPLTQSQSKK